MKTNKYYLFLIVLVIYKLLFSLLEYPYLNFLYTTPLDIFGSYDVTNPLVGALRSLKKNSLLIHLLFVFKIILLPFLLFEKTRRFSGVLSLILAYLFMKLSNNTSPEQGYLNLILLVIIFYPDVFMRANSNNLDFSDFLKNSLWFIFGLSYTSSGYSKFITPNWQDGTYLFKFAIENQTFNDHFSFLLFFPLVLKLMTYFGLFSELLCLPLVLFKKTRFFGLLFTTFLQIGLLFLAEVYQITVGMIIFHFFMFCLSSNLREFKFTALRERF